MIFQCRVFFEIINFLANKESIFVTVCLLLLNDEMELKKRARESKKLLFFGLPTCETF
jgi:hypothetical protein